MDSEEVDLQGLSAEEIAEVFATEVEPEPDPAEVIEELPEFEPSRPGIKDRLVGKRDEIRQQLAGVDPIPPKSGVVIEVDPNDPFLKLLRPLAPNEILALSAQVAEDDTVFVKVERERRNQFRAHNLASFLTAAVMVVFALLVGPEFITETLTSAKIPGWVPDEVPLDVVQGALFVLGILVPIAAGFALLDGLRNLLSCLSRPAWSSAVKALPGLIFAPLALALVSSGSVIMALGTLAIYWALHVVLELWRR